MLLRRRGGLLCARDAERAFALPRARARARVAPLGAFGLAAARRGARHASTDAAAALVRADAAASADPAGPRRRWRHVLDTASTGADHFRTAVRAAFRLIDADRDGTASRADVSLALQKYSLVQELLLLPRDVSDSEFEQLFEIIDGDGDGRVDEHAWRTFFLTANTSAGISRPPTPRYDPKTSGVTAFLIDLDGTLYTPGRLIPGARNFYAWLLGSRTPHVFLSNTGSKGPEGTQRKLHHAPYKLHHAPVPLSHIMTAADAQADYMTRTLPAGSRILVVSGGGSFWRVLLERRDRERVASWDVRTELTDEHAMRWALEAQATRCAGPAAPRVVVAFFIDGNVCQADGGDGGDGFGGSEGGAGWNYSLIKHCAFLLGHGAYLVYTADDPFNPQSHKKHAGAVFPLPGPGMFASMLRPVVPLESQDRILCCGKGGNVGASFMMEQAIEMLKQQGHSGERDTIMTVGDRFGTDVRGAAHAGLKSCLVESGCEQIRQQDFYPTDRATYWAPSVDYIHPLGPGRYEPSFDSGSQGHSL